jgi:hypothetical protein
MNNEKPKNLQECFERIKKACETLENEYGYSKYAKFNPPLTEKQIQELEEYENRLGFKLPEAYKEFLKFSNGAVINGLEIYELDMIGMPDDYVPDGYLAISSTEMTSRRLAISDEDGTLYLFWDLQPDTWDFEYEIMSLLEKCEECIIEHEEKARKASRTPDEIKRDEEELDNFIAELNQFFKERNKNE